MNLEQQEGNDMPKKYESITITFPLEHWILILLTLEMQKLWQFERVVKMLQANSQLDLDQSVESLLLVKATRISRLIENALARKGHKLTHASKGFEFEVERTQERIIELIDWLFDEMS